MLAAGGVGVALSGAACASEREAKTAAKRAARENMGGLT